MTATVRKLAAMACGAMFFGLAAAAAVAQGAAKLPTEDEKLAAFLEDVFQRNLKSSPIFQAQLGMKGPDYAKWNDFSDEEAQRQDKLNRQDLERLHADFEYDALSERMKVSYRIFELERQSQVDLFPWRFHSYAFQTLASPVTSLVTFMQNIHRVDDVSDAEAYISRLEGTTVAFKQGNVVMNEAARRGIVPTSFSFDPVLRDARAVLEGAPFDGSGKDSAILAEFRGKLDKLKAGEAEKKRLLRAAVAAMKGALQTSLRETIANIEALRPKSPGPNGVWKLPNGDEYYKAQIKFWTTVPGFTAERIHDIGLTEASRIKSEMEAIMKKVGFQGDLPAFFKHLRTDPKNFYPNTAEGKKAYLDQSKAYIDSIYADVGKYFNVLPKAPLEVRAVEEWREATASIAFYDQATPDGSRPGIYYVNLRDMTTRQKHEMETVAYHEGAPGHHFQIAIQQELEGVPSFQKFAWFGAYVEGWGLYAERVAKEQGRFTDPMQDFGRLQNEMLRACRLVVDTGAHAKKWTREQMIEYLLANNPITAEDAIKEAERYIDNPGQALSYTIGMLKILELREKAKAALGDKFDIRDFHDVVLKNGAVPLPVLEELVDGYVAASGPAGRRGGGSLQH
jgi:uncharacterized protein (DUF885 family)